MTGMLPLHQGEALVDDLDVPLFDLDDELALDLDWRCLACGHDADDHDEDGCARTSCPCARRP